QPTRIYTLSLHDALPIYVDEELGSMVRLPRHRAGRVPAVLAHGDADAYAALLEDRAAMADREVALLVEHAVVRQEHLVVNGLERSEEHTSELQSPCNLVC